MKTFHSFALAAAIALVAPGVRAGAEAKEKSMETLQEISAAAHEEGLHAYRESPFSALSKDYFLRFSRDPEARPAKGEVMIDEKRRITLASDADPLVELMAMHLAEFLKGRMGVTLAVEKQAARESLSETRKAIVLLDSGGGDPDVPESFEISVTAGTVVVRGHDPAGLRDGVVKLVDRMGFREAPILAVGSQVYRPRLRVRLGSVPFMGSYKDLVFLGYNAVFAGGGDLYGFSTSDAIPELAVRRRPGSLENSAKGAREARKYGLKTYAFLNTRQKFPKDDPVFAAHPDIRGALTWKADGEYTLCTEHPLVRQFLTESVTGLFQADPELDGITIIIGGEGFYHCFMRPYGVPKGRTNCPRCDAIGADAVVANLCNALAGAARKVNPKAEVVAWPYSAEHVWSSDRPHTGFIRNLRPGTAIFTEIEKDEYAQKPDGVNKHLWDYSIDLIGPGERARQQVALCGEMGIPIYMKSEPELGFEAPRLAHIPCLDRWAERAEALVTCGADGAWVFPAFRPCYGTSAAEAYKFFWWEPVPERDELLERLAERIAGEKAGPQLRAAWKHVSDAIAWSPELPSYYTGPYYLGPAHPMCADPQAELPEVFYGYYLFMAEMTDSEGVRKRPTFVVSPTGNVPVFGAFYRKMEGSLRQAAEAITAAEPLVDERHRLMFASEASSIRWFYATARTEANFYESCQLRDQLLAIAGKPSKTDAELAKARELYSAWRKVLRDERENAAAALPVAEADVRLDFRYGGDHTFSHTNDMLPAKLAIIDREIKEFLPSVARRCGFEPED